LNDIEKELEGLYEKFETMYRRKMGDDSPNNAQAASSSKDTSSSLASIVPSEFQSFLESSAAESSKSELLIYLDEANVSVHERISTCLIIGR
jgi:hypothetical protein